MHADEQGEVQSWHEAVPFSFKDWAIEKVCSRRMISEDQGDQRTKTTLQPVPVPFDREVFVTRLCQNRNTHCSWKRSRLTVL